MRDVKLVFISGPFRATTTWDVEQNVRAAEAFAAEILRLGALPVCPHTNTRFFNGLGDDGAILDGYLKLMDRCDAVFALPTWNESFGARAEITRAGGSGMPLFGRLKDLEEWLKS